MEKILEPFRRFIARDLVVMLAGGAAVGTFLYLFDRAPAPNDSWILFALLAGVSYFVATSAKAGEKTCV